MVSGPVCSDMMFAICVSGTMMISNDANLDGMAPGLFLFAVDVFEHMVHLFKSPAPSLWDEEECPGK